jgi:hypothetical protein
VKLLAADLRPRFFFNPKLSTATRAPRAHKRIKAMSKESKFNALKTGAYALESALPWENAAEKEKLRAEVFKAERVKGKAHEFIAENLVENIWLQRRVRNTTAIATHRHVFGQALEEAGVANWRDAISSLRAYNLKMEKTLATIAKAESQLAEVTAQWSERTDEELTKRATKIHNILRKNAQRLSEIVNGLDAQREFFLEYSPKHLERRIRLENSLQAQNRKIRADLLIEQEAERLREKSGKSGEDPEDSTDNSTGPRDNSAGPRGNIDQDGVPTVNERERTSDDACADTDDDLLRDDSADDWDSESDPFAEFVQKNS